MENFFSSGFAFPEFTLLNKTLFQMGRRALGHGFLDHELLHCWWGNGIYVDPADGNWCEALTSYAANYYGYVLDGDDQGARKQRRNCCMIVSGIKPEQDKPLGSFDRRTARAAKWATTRALWSSTCSPRESARKTSGTPCALTRDYVGRYASWSTLQEVCEQRAA